MLLSPQLRPPTALGRGSSRVAARCLHPGFGRTRPLRSAMPINAAAPTAAPVQGLASHAAGEDRARMGPSLGWERDFQQRYSIQELKGQGQFGKVRLTGAWKAWEGKKLARVQARSGRWNRNRRRPTWSTHETSHARPATHSQPPTLATSCCAQVYSAVLRSTGREVAVKVIPKQSPAGRHHHPAQDPAAHLQHHLQCIRDEASHWLELRLTLFTCSTAVWLHAWTLQALVPKV